MRARLLAGGAVHRAASVPRALVPRSRTASASGASRWGGSATDEQMQSSIRGSLLGPLGQVLRMDRAKDRTAGRVEDGNDHLGFARRVEDDPIQRRAAACNLDQLACACRLHRDSVLALLHVPSHVG